MNGHVKLMARPGVRLPLADLAGASTSPRRLPGVRRGAVTLLELLVVCGMIALLAGLLLPGVSRAREQARAAVCGSNLRQLALANSMYAQEMGTLVPGAAAMVKKNLHRWHGVRVKQTEAFEPARGPLAPYLGEDGGVRACPTFSPEKKGFEAGNGGYGYNNAYIGVQTATLKGSPIIATDLAGTRPHVIKRPADTLMFADAAFVSGALIEYSFAEPRFHPQFGSRTDPSIHFRHGGLAGVAWCDGHVDLQRRTFSAWSGLYEGDPARHNIGWFGDADDNRLFDLN